MDLTLNNLRSTKADVILGIIRLALGMMFFSTGIMKYTIPMLWEAWSGQLTQANIPLFTLNVYMVPIIEMTIGVLLLIGYYSRISALIVLPLMIVATYVHLIVGDPTLFPLQPDEPIIPIVAILMAGYVIWRGGGSWSKDLKSSKLERSYK